MKPVIFLGPSIPKAEAEKILDAVYLPPVTQGDILTVMNKYKPRVIGIIDGVFFQNLSVWHKELLLAMHSGIHLMGSSSMGALRAAELDDYGMLGIGEIYRYYTSGEIEDDDEVALVYGPPEDNYRNLSDPMVNLRATYAYAKENGGMSAAEYDYLLDYSKRAYFPDRELGNLLTNLPEDVIKKDRASEILSFCRDNYVDRKRLDAIELLEHIRDLPEDHPPHEPVFELTHNHLLEALYQRDRQVFSEGSSIRQHQILEHASIHMRGFGEFNQAALNRATLICLASYLSVDAEPEDIAKEERRFRVKRRILDPDVLKAWLDDNDLSEVEFQALMREQAIIRRFNKWINTFFSKVGTAKALMDQMKLNDTYTHWKSLACEEEQVMRENYSDMKVTEFKDVTFQDLVLDQIRNSDFELDTHYTNFPREAGYHNPHAFKLAMFRAQLHRKRKAK